MHSSHERAEFDSRAQMAPVDCQVVQLPVKSQGASEDVGRDLGQ